MIFQHADQLPENKRRGERERVFNLAKQINTLRNHTSHPSEGDLPFESAFQGLNAARRILEKIDKKEPARRVRELLDQLHGRGAEAWPTPLPPRETTDDVKKGRSERAEGRAGEVLVVPAGRYASDDYYQYGAYLCQPSRPFRDVTRMALYDQGKILKPVPVIKAMLESVSLNEDGFREIEDQDLDADLKLEARQLLKKLLSNSKRTRGEREFKIMLLSREGDPETVVLKQEVTNDKKDYRGRPTAFVQGQRYVSLAKLQNAERTSDLE